MELPPIIYGVLPSKKNCENADSIRDDHIARITDENFANEENSVSELDLLKEEEKQLKKQLLIETRQLLNNLDQLQSKFDIIAHKKSRLLAKMEKIFASEKQTSMRESSYRLFSIVTRGASWTDGLVFTVMAENDFWAKEVVCQWLNSNGREYHRIDKVLALGSKDVRAIVNVGAILSNVSIIQKRVKRCETT